jgi:hypothetical protein
MMTKCFTLRWDDNSISVVDAIEYGFPCFVRISDRGAEFYEVTIEARVEDWASIERRLAPYV